VVYVLAAFLWLGGLKQRAPVVDDGRIRKTQLLFLRISVARVRILVSSADNASSLR
jgi:hypothetical protein